MIQNQFIYLCILHCLSYMLHFAAILYALPLTAPYSSGSNFFIVHVRNMLSVDLSMLAHIFRIHCPTILIQYVNLFHNTYIYKGLWCWTILQKGWNIYTKLTPLLQYIYIYLGQKHDKSAPLSWALTLRHVTLFLTLRHGTLFHKFVHFYSDMCQMIIHSVSPWPVQSSCLWWIPWCRN